MKLEVFVAIHLANAYRKKKTVGDWQEGRRSTLKSLIVTYGLDRKEIADEIRAMRNKQRAAA